MEASRRAWAIWTARILPPHGRRKWVAGGAIGVNGLVEAGIVEFEFVGVKEVSAELKVFELVAEALVELGGSAEGPAEANGDA